MITTFDFQTNNPFQWKVDFFQRTDILLQHYQDISAKLSACVAQGLMGDRSRQLYQQLSREHRMLLATSPNVYEQLQALMEATKLDQDEDFAALATEQLKLYIYAEAHRASLIKDTLDHAFWTASRDYVTDRSLSPVVALECGIVLDYDSYIHHTPASSFEPYTHHEALDIAGFLDQAVALIKKTNPSAYSLLTSYTSSIELRKDPKAKGISNSSMDYSIGKLISHNMHLHGGDVTEGIDFLVHESMHQYLFTFEKTYPFIHRSSPLRVWNARRDLYSPWSGNPLDLSSFTHAIVVWYGLFHFWDQFLNCDQLSLDKQLHRAASLRRETASGGFLWETSLTKSFGVKKHLLPLWYTDLIEHYQSEVVSLCLAGRG